MKGVILAAPMRVDHLLKRPVAPNMVSIVVRRIARTRLPGAAHRTLESVLYSIRGSIILDEVLLTMFVIPHLIGVPWVGKVENRVVRIK